MDTVQAAGSAAERGGDDGAGAQLADFSSWLARERGLSPVTVRCYSKQTRVFLAGLPGPLDAALRGLDARQVTAFMLDFCPDRNTWSAKAMVTSLRAFLRFAHATGRTAVPLAGAVPVVASWRPSAPPPRPPTAAVERPVGRRGPGTAGRPRGFCGPCPAGPPPAGGAA